MQSLHTCALAMHLHIFYLRCKLIIFLLVRRAEVKVAVTLVSHNIPLAFADHLSPLFKEFFPDSKIAKKYCSARKKTSAIINKPISPYLLNELVSNMRSKPFSLSTDAVYSILSKLLHILTHTMVRLL